MNPYMGSEPTTCPLPFCFAHFALLESFLRPLVRLLAPASGLLIAMANDHDNEPPSTPTTPHSHHHHKRTKRFWGSFFFSSPVQATTPRISVLFVCSRTLQEEIRFLSFATINLVEESKVHHSFLHLQSRSI